MKLNLANDGDDRPEIFNSVVNTIGGFAYLGLLYQIFGGGAVYVIHSGAILTNRAFYCFAMYLSQVVGLLLFHSQHSFNPSYNVKEGTITLFEAKLLKAGTEGTVP